MKTATKGDKPDWFNRPSNVVGVNVCRMSGLLPNDGCDHVQVVNKDGNIETRSMIYTDYFVKGTQPTTVCPLHPAGSFIDAFAGALGIQVGHPAPADAASMPPPSATSTAGTTPGANAVHGGKVAQKADEEEQPKKKKKGFWSRLFGRDDKKDDKDKQR
jgi:hypothetical protein